MVLSPRSWLVSHRVCGLPHPTFVISQLPPTAILRGDVTKEVKAEVGARQLILRIMRGQFSSKMTMFLMCRHTPIPQPGICPIEILTCVDKGVCKRVFNGTLWEENGQ